MEQDPRLLLYKASAGSGKTFTLAVQYIRLLIEDPFSYRRILAVTFTNKATTEMKERILNNFSLKLISFLLAFLQAWLCIQILPLLLIGVSLLSGHLFALSGGKAANIFFVVSLLLLLLLFVFNLWIFL